ncbi:M48 family metallopeptidase [Patescibacteria group bacterium]|nr:M48 family metallopeptidase [Patescibacteria group bacterium]
MNFSFEYLHKTNKRSKSLKLSIDRSGKIIVTSPKYIPKFVIDQFVKKNEKWIIKAIKKANQTKKFDSTTHLFIFGKKYQKEIAFSDTTKSGIHVIGEKLIFNPLTPLKNTRIINEETIKHKQDLEKRFQTKVDNFLKSTASHYIVKRTYELGKRMNLSFKNITLRKQKTRWGSCSNQRNLNFNWRLVHFDTTIIDYVIIHELSHLVHMNHSKDFWGLVKKYDPKYLNHRSWLKRNGLSLD